VGTKDPVHPNDHVNLGQSSNDVFPTAIHIAAVTAIEDSLLPALSSMEQVLKEKSVSFKDVVKTGRTHLQDAVIMSLGQEFSAFASQLRLSRHHIEHTLEYLRELPIGGTARMRAAARF
jgi:fumarate hydratase class II